MYTKNIRLFLALLFIMIEAVLCAQQEPMYFQYFFNNSVINPAHAGSSSSNQVGILIRDQWAGIDGSPKTIMLSTNIRLPKQLGLAAGIYQERIGPEVNLHIQTDLAYHARLTEDWCIAAGIRFTFSHLKVGLTEVPYIDPRNPYFTVDISSGLKLNTGTGLLAYNNQYFFGISIPETFRTKIKASLPGVDDFEKKETRNLYTYGGGNFYLPLNLIFIPSVMIRFGKNPTQLDFNSIFSYKNIFDFGPLIRSNFTQIKKWFNSVGFLINIRYLENLHLGYTYEFPTSDLRYATVQTHEISLRFTWESKQSEDIRSPKFFF
jgi:type IX secretion system PorP/SprF family membrane protein